MKFDALDLRPELRANIAAMGWHRATDIQYRAITPTLRGEDILAVAQTGTGKTAAFGIPTVELLLRRNRPRNYNGVRCIVMEPTHELARQVGDVIAQLAMDTGLEVAAIYGGVSQEPQTDVLNRRCDIVVATPGRLFDLKSQGYLQCNRCEILILDEADHMLDLGFIDDIRQLVRSLPRHRQTLFYSATIDEKIKKIAYTIVNRPINIRISPKDRVARNVTHEVISVPMDEKRFYLERIYHENPDCRIMVFVRTRVRAERVMAAMERAGIKAVNMHGSKSQSERTNALETFRRGDVRMLIATDVTARGIDIPQVNYVVNYDVPDMPENYVHRVGRTGRGMDKGYALTFCADEERPLLEEVEDYLEEEITLLDMNRADRQATIDLATEAKHDWQQLVNDEIALEEHRGKPIRHGRNK